MARSKRPNNGGATRRRQSGRQRIAHRARLSKAEATRVGHIHRNTITEFCTAVQLYVRSSCGYDRRKMHSRKLQNTYKLGLNLKWHILFRIIPRLIPRLIPRRRLARWRGRRVRIRPHVISEPREMIVPFSSISLLRKGWCTWCKPRSCSTYIIIK